MGRFVLTSGALLGAIVAAAFFARAADDTPLKFRCLVKDAQILPDRTHVRCSNRGMNGLSEFAAETNQPYANQVANAIIQSLRTGTSLVITYAPSDELNPEGCNRRTCRKIIEVGGSGVAVRPPMMQPMPPLPTQPLVGPEDFDAVDTSVDEPRQGGSVAPPPPSPPRKPALAPFQMRPIPN